MTSREQHLLESVDEDHEPGKALLLEMLWLASDEVLMMSVMHCHAWNVSSIVLDRRDDGSLTRAFLAWPGHQLHMGVATVGAHDHRYPIKLTGLRGLVVNDEWSEHIVIGERSVPFWFSIFDSVLTGGAGPRWLGIQALRPVRSTALTPGRSLSLAASAIHSMYCHGAAAWLVEEGKAERDRTRLFTVKQNVETTGMYLPFKSASHVRAHVYEFVEMRVRE